MSFLGKRINAVHAETLEKVPAEWFLSISDLSKPEIKDYMDEDFRKKALSKMIMNVVDDYKNKKNPNIVDYNDPQVRKKINDETTSEQIKKAREYAKSKEKNIQ
jgi:hypothetical protein